MLLSPLARQVHVYGAHDDGANDDVLDVRGDLHQVQAVPENTKNEDPHQRGTDAADAAADSAAADHHGGNRIKLLHLAERGLTRDHTRRQDHARHTREQPAGDVYQHLIFRDVDAREHGCFLVAAHRVDVAAEARAAENHVREQERDYGDDRRNGERSDVTGTEHEELPRKPGDWQAATEGQRGTARGNQHAQRGDERRDPGSGDDQAADQSGNASCRDAGRDSFDQAELPHHLRADDADEGQQRSNRKVDAAAQNRERLTEGKQREDRNLTRHVRQVRHAPEVRIDRAEDDRQRHDDRGHADSAPTRVPRIARHALRCGGASKRAVQDVLLGGFGARVLAANTAVAQDRKSTRLNSSHSSISYAVFCLKKKKKKKMAHKDRSNHAYRDTTYSFSIMRSNLLC